MQMRERHYGGNVFSLNTERICQYEPGTQSQEFLDGKFCIESNVSKLTFEEVTSYLTINDQMMFIEKEYTEYV